MGSDTEDCGGPRAVGSYRCPWLFVFDFTDETLLAPVAPSAPPPPDGCSWPADGECDVPRYCPAGTDTCDCLGQNCPCDSPSFTSSPWSHILQFY